VLREAQKALEGVVTRTRGSGIQRVKGEEEPSEERNIPKMGDSMWKWTRERAWFNGNWMWIPGARTKLNKRPQKKIGIRWCCDKDIGLNPKWNSSYQKALSMHSFICNQLERVINVMKKTKHLQSTQSAKNQQTGLWAKPCKCLERLGLWKKQMRSATLESLTAAQHPRPWAATQPPDLQHQKEVPTIHSGELAVFRPGRYRIVQLSL
jgi:hypothetical protein